MKAVDLHCDTLSVCLSRGGDLISNNFQLDVTRLCRQDGHIQVFACFLSDEWRGEAAYDYFLAQYAILKATIEKSDLISWYGFDGKMQPHHCHALVSVEGGHAIHGDISLIPKLKELGISFFTLVWNGDNELGCGARGGSDGLTEIGRQAVMELQKEDIVVDVSHLNERGIDEVLYLAEKPIAATHSNSRSICENRRNLTDEQLKKLFSGKGICGLNYYPVFINGKDDCGLDDIRRHTDKMLALGGESCLALGSDFDGADMPSFLLNCSGLYILYENMVKWYGEAVADKIFYGNAQSFIDKNLGKLGE